MSTSVARSYAHRPVALRPDRRPAHRPPPPPGRPDEALAPLAGPAGRPAGRRVRVLRRPGRRRPADPGRAAHRRARPRGGGRQLRAGSTSSSTDGRRPGDRGPGRGPSGGPGRFDDPGVGGGERRRGLGRRRAGPRRATGDPHSIRPAKGVHVTVPPSRLPCDIAAVIPVPADHRSIFVVPWPEGDLVYLGTTDTAYDGPLDDPACTPEDVDYLLGAVNAVTTPAHRAGPTSPACGPGCGPCWPRSRAPAARRAHRRPVPPPHRADLGAPAWSPSPAASSPPTGRWPRTPSTSWSPHLGAGRRRCVTKNLRLHGAPAGPVPPTPVGRRRGRPDRPTRRRGDHLAGRYGTEADARARPGRRAARAARAAGGRPALSGGRGGLRRARRDGPDRGRRPGPPDPGRASGTPGPRPGRRRAWPPCWPPSWAGTPSGRRPRPSAYAGRASTPSWTGPG